MVLVKTTPVSIDKNPISPVVPWSYQERLLWLPDSTRSMGIHIMAGKGSGKSRLMGRVITWLDFLRGFSQVIYDPYGPTIDNFLDKLNRLPDPIRQKLLSRVVYIDMSGRFGRILPFSLYYRMGNESLFKISQRYLDIVRKIDPFLQTASVEGWNALWRTGTYAGMILAGLNYQISEAEEFVLHPLLLEPRFPELLKRYPETHTAIQYMHELAKSQGSARARRTESFFNKIALFSLDPNMKAMFGSAHVGLDWQEVLGKRMIVLFDFRHEHDLEQRRFKMVWTFNYLLDFIKHRGAGRHQPIGLIIDELTLLFSIQSLTSELMGAELDELINVIARNFGVWLTIAHQESFQITERILKSLMTMGTQILGVTTDPEAAQQLAQLFFEYRPYWVKKIENVWGSENGLPVVLDYRTVEFTIEEQLILQARKFLKQDNFNFLVRPALSEGNIQGKIKPVSIKNLDRNVFPDDERIAYLRASMMSEHGLSISGVLHEISQRLQTSQETKYLPEGDHPQVSGSVTDIDEDLWGF
jgi:hypothetical protein